MAVGDIFRMATKYIVDDAHEVVNVYHYRQEMVTLSDPLETLAEEWWDAAAPLLGSIFTGRVKLDQIQVRGVTDPLLGVDVAINHAFTLSGDLLPLSVAGIITWRTGLIGRSRRGRSYMGPLQETAQNGGILVSSMVDYLDDYATGIRQLTRLGLVAWQLIVWSPTLGAGLPVVSHTVQPLTGTIRKRRQGTGS